MNLYHFSTLKRGRLFILGEDRNVAISHDQYHGLCRQAISSHDIDLDFQE